MPLSTQGISHQIVSALKTFKLEKLGTESDCKVVINLLIRKFSEPLVKEGKQKEYSSKKLSSDNKRIKEHLLPVNEIMKYLFSIELNDKDDLALIIHNYLLEAIVIVNITESEDYELNKHKCQRRMPDGFSDSNSDLFKDIWARYKCADIYKNIEIIE